MRKRKNNLCPSPNGAAGFSLVELMLAMLIGLIIMGGVMQLFISTRDTQRSSDDQLAMLGNARFAIETIAYDLRHANMWGRHNNGKLIVCQKAGATSLPCPGGSEMPAATDDCAVGEYINIERPLFAVDNSSTNPYSATCTKQAYKNGTDVLTVRYADTNKIGTNVLSSDVAYLRTGLAGGALFMGKGPDVLPSMPLVPGWKDETKASNHILVSRVYYVSDYSDSVGDGLPSLRRGDLIAGPEMSSDVLLTGVEDLQLEFGIDVGTNGVLGKRDGQVDAYVKASGVTNWGLDVVSARIWVLMRTERADKGGISSTQTFTIAGTVVNTPNDGFRRYLVSSVVKLRNTSQINVQSAGS